MNKSYAIFDMDGTLIDSMTIWDNLAEEFLHSEGVAHIDDEVYEIIKPMTMPESSQYFIDTFNLRGSVEEVLGRMSDTIDEHYRHDIPLKPKVRNYLESLRGKDVKMCVASSTPEPLMEICLRRLGVRDYFEFILSCDSVGKGKSHPDVYMESARRLDAKPCDIAVFEDAHFALDTAKKAGFYTVGVYDEAEKSEWTNIVAMADEVINFN